MDSRRWMGRSRESQDRSRKSSDADLLDAPFTLADLAKLDHTAIELSPLQDAVFTDASDTVADSFQIEVSKKVRELHIARQEAETEVFIDRLVSKVGGLDRALLYVVSEMDNNEARIQVLVTILLQRGAHPSASTRSLQTPLHMAASRNMLGIASKLLENDAPTTARDAADTLPLHYAIEKGHDQMASILVANTSNYFVRGLFMSDGSKDAEFSFHQLLQKKLQRTAMSVLDCMLEPYGSSDQVRVFYSLLESDECGRSPVDPLFNSHQHTAFQQIAKMGDKSIVNHDAVRLLIRKKWKSYARLQFIISGILYLISLMALTYAAITAVQTEDPTQYPDAIQVTRAVFEIIALLVAVFSVLTELNQFRRSPFDYLKDGFNYFEFPSAILILTILPLRFTHTTEQWYVFSAGYLLWTLRLFKYATIFRQTGAYAQILWRIMAHDMVQFSAVFLVILLAFSGSFYLSLRADGGLDVHQETSTFWGILFLGVRILSEAERVVDYAGPEGYKTMSVILYVCFLFTICVIMLNLLIAQLSDTYQNIQADAHRGLEVHRAWSIARVELNTSFCGPRGRNRFYAEFEDYPEMKEALEKWDMPPLNQMSVFVREIYDTQQTQKMDTVTVKNRLARQDAFLLNMQNQLDRIDAMLSLICPEDTNLRDIERHIRTSGSDNHPIGDPDSPTPTDRSRVRHPDEAKQQRYFVRAGSIGNQSVHNRKSATRISGRTLKDKVHVAPLTDEADRTLPNTYSENGAQAHPSVPQTDPGWRVHRTNGTDDNTFDRDLNFEKDVRL